jgi:hypothetical protein
MPTATVVMIKAAKARKLAARDLIPLARGDMREDRTVRNLLGSQVTTSSKHEDIADGRLAHRAPVPLCPHATDGRGDDMKMTRRDLEAILATLDNRISRIPDLSDDQGRFIGTWILPLLEQTIKDVEETKAIR